MSPDISQRDPSSGASPEPRPSRRKKILWAGGAIAFVLVLGLIVHARIASHRTPAAGRGGFRAGGAFGAMAVGVARVTTGDVPVTIDSLGTVTPLATVTVHPQVTGPLMQITFNEGQTVKAGELLAEIDPRPFQAALDQAQGQLQHDQALLANARVDLTRYKTLVAQNSVAEQTYATQQAVVLQDRATLATDNAAIETARLNLSYCRITSPVDGTVGLRQVDKGNMVTAYVTAIVVVAQLHPMSVLFTVPEDNLTEVLSRVHRGEKLSAEAYDRTFTTKLDTGVLANIDNQIDTTTGTLKLRALFNNSQAELFPNQFVNIRLTLNTLHDQLLVPGAAVQTGTSGTYVYVVDAPSTDADPTDAAPTGRGTGAAGAGGPGGFGGAPGETVHVRAVTTGPTVGNMISIRDGLQAGETVVVDGADQLRDGARVTLPAAQPASGKRGYGPGAAGGARPPGARRGGAGGYPRGAVPRGQPPSGNTAGAAAGGAPPQ